jgi:hypothetical protein
MNTVRMEVMRNPTQIRLYDIFRKDLHLPDDRAQNLVSTINEALNDHSEQDREDLATKEFVREEIKSLRAEFRDEFRSVRTEIGSVRDRFRDLEISITRQIFLVNLIQFLALVGAVLAIYTFLRK